VTDSLPYLSEAEKRLTRIKADNTDQSEKQKQDCDYEANAGVDAHPIHTSTLSLFNPLLSP
jgi:hypothetical protein